MSRLPENQQWSINLVNTETSDFQIIAYCCKHCAYAAADLAGGLRMQYSPAVKIVELPCTGRIDILTLLEALEQGADGIMVAG
jgi:F420-non-reducing hydrogenase iron-sulfur subunit